VNPKSGAGGTWSSFNATVFEAAVLAKLVELKAADVMPEADGSGAVVRLSALYAAKENELREFQKEIDGDPKLLKTLKPTLLRLDAEREQLAAELAEAQREAASPLAETWGEFKSVAELLAKDGGDDLRLRCRAAIRRLVESITVLFTGSKMIRLAAVRVQFRGTDAHRDYLIVSHSRNGTRKNPPPPEIVSARWDQSAAGELDLRDPADAAKVEKFLTAVDVDELVKKLRQVT
jgi:hypothetical protein